MCLWVGLLALRLLCSSVIGFVWLLSSTLMLTTLLCNHSASTLKQSLPEVYSIMLIIMLSHATYSNHTRAEQKSKRCSHSPYTLLDQVSSVSCFGTVFGSSSVSTSKWGSEQTLDGTVVMPHPAFFPSLPLLSLTPHWHSCHLSILSVACQCSNSSTDQLIPLLCPSYQWRQWGKD